MAGGGRGWSGGHGDRRGRQRGDGGVDGYAGGHRFACFVGSLLGSRACPLLAKPPSLVLRTRSLYWCYSLKALALG